MNFTKILTFIFGLFSLYETDLSELEAGQAVTSPQVQVGTVGGKPLYASAILSTVKV